MCRMNSVRQKSHYFTREANLKVTTYGKELVKVKFSMREDSK